VFYELNEQINSLNKEVQVRLWQAQAPPLAQAQLPMQAGCAWHSCPCAECCFLSSNTCCKSSKNLQV